MSVLCSSHCIPLQELNRIKSKVQIKCSKEGRRIFASEACCSPNIKMTRNQWLKKVRVLFLCLASSMTNNIYIYIYIYNSKWTEHRVASWWFFLSVALCAKTGVLTMESGGSWCYRKPLAGPWWYQSALPTRCKSTNSKLPNTEITRGR